MEDYACEEVRRRLPDYLDRELDGREQEQIRLHLQVCPHCAGRMRFEASVLREIRAQLARLSAPPRLLARVNAALAHVPAEL